MRIIIDFTCPEGHTHEEYVERETQEVRCNQCDLMASRVISPVRSVMDPLSGDFHDASRKWAKHHEQMAKKGEDA